jgi:predicted murein hydrolase (TIGR00659 family)
MINPFGLMITILLYKAMEFLKKLPFIGVFPPLLTTGILLILILKIFRVDYHVYNESASYLTFLLIPATISLGYPLYKNVDILVKNKRIIYTAFVFATLCALTTTFITAKCCHSGLKVLVSLLPKSVTAPIAVEISKSLGGIPELTACIVALTGVFGAVFGHKILNLIKVKSDIAIGLSIGAASHVLGTSRCVEEGREKQIAMSTLALVIVGVLTAIITPIFTMVLKLKVG